jgi:hypothetical protein
MLFAQNRGRGHSFRAASHLSRRQRQARHTSRLLMAVLVLVNAIMGVLLLAIAPREEPVVTVYMHHDCESCRRWMEHLAASGFRTRVGDESEWPAVRAQLRLEPGFQSSHTAVVDGLLIEGPVPARDIHLALEWRASHYVRGLVVPGVPRGSPGMESAFPQPYTVFAVRQGGAVQAFDIHDH